MRREGTHRGRTRWLQVNYSYDAVIGRPVLTIMDKCPSTLWTSMPWETEAREAAFGIRVRLSWLRRPYVEGPWGAWGWGNGFVSPISAGPECPGQDFFAFPEGLERQNKSVLAVREGLERRSETAFPVPNDRRRQLNIDFALPEVRRRGTKWFFAFLKRLNAEIRRLPPVYASD